MARTLDRLEIWTDVAANSGARSYVVPDWIAATESLELGGREILRITLRRESDAWSSIVERRVIRTQFTDSTFKEWRITRIDEGRSGSGLDGSLTCEGIKYDLGTTMMSRTEADGSVNPYFELYGLTPTEHLGLIVNDSPSYFSAGNVASSGDYDMVYDWATPLAAADALAQAANLELNVRHTSTGYVIDLSTQVGSTADTVYFRYARNLSAVKRQTNVTEKMVTRVYPRGGGSQGDRLTIRDNAWLVASVSSATITLSTVDGNPITIADMLNSLWLEEPSGTITQISDSSTTPTLVMASAAHGVSAGERVTVRGSSAGADLIYLDDPVNQATYGVVQRVLDRQDIPPVNNLVETAFLDSGWGALPTNWNKVGAPTVSETTSPLNRTYGTASARVQCASSGLGLQTDIVPINPSTGRPFYTGQIALRVVNGAIKLELVDVSSTQGGVYPPADAEPAITTVVDQWVENLGIGGIDFNEVASTGIRLKVTSYSTGASEFYLDAAMLTQTAGGVDTFYNKRASNALWMAGANYIYDYGTPTVSFDINVLDLERLNPSVFTESLILGGTVKVTDSDLGLDFETRTIEIRRDLATPGLSQIKLSNSLDDLSGLGVPGRPRRKIRDGDTTKFRRPILTVTSTGAGSTGMPFTLTAKTDGQLVAIYTDTHDSTAASTGFTRTPSTGWKESGYSATVIGALPGLDDPARVFEAYAIDKRGAKSASFIGSLDAQSLIVPEVTAILSHTSSGDGKVTLEIYDPGTYVTGTGYDIRSGSTGTAVFEPSTDPTGWGDWNSTAPYPLTETVTLGEKHDSYIAWAVRWNDGSTVGDRWIKRVETFDIDDIPEVSGTAHFSAAGILGGDYNGDDDVGSIWYRPSSTGFFASVSSTNGVLVAGRAGSFNSTLTLSADTVGYLTIQPRGGATGGGTTGPLLKIKTSAFSVGEDGGNWVKIVNPRFTRRTLNRFAVSVDIEVGSLTEKVGISYTDPTSGNLTPVTPAHGVEQTIVQAVGTVRSTNVMVLTTAGSTVLWGIASTAPSVIVTPISTVPLDGTAKYFHFDVIGVDPVGFSRLKKQDGSDTKLIETLQPSTGGGIEMSTAGTIEVKMSDLVHVSTADPTGAWGADQDGWLWIKPV